MAVMGERSSLEAVSTPSAASGVRSSFAVLLASLSSGRWLRGWYCGPQEDHLAGLVVASGWIRRKRRQHQGFSGKRHTLGVDVSRNYRNVAIDW